MLTSTFIHLPGIGLKKERALWEAGILTWDDFERSQVSQHSFDFGLDGSAAPVLDESRKALASGDLDYFASRLPKAEHYRVALACPALTAFIDIETTGLSHYYDEITVVGVGTTDDYRFLVKGQQDRQFLEYLRQFKCIVTFNGTLFDLKFLKRDYPQLELPNAHVDLRFLGRRVGLSGGQKSIEQQLNVSRDFDVEGLLGENAPILWHQYRMGDIQSAVRLVEYNRADVDGMRSIFDYCARSILTEAGPTGGALPPLPRFSDNGPRPQSGWTTPPPVEAYHGHVGPRATYKSITSQADVSGLRVIGIDLTGSEKRESGWCLLDGSNATTLRLGTDHELLAATIEANPTLISIDSPLSLPRGRTRVTDDDEGRVQFGIMRECERILKARGVNVYPSLIKSMQALTARGIRLASSFRKLGFPVIESYPGAAQDIMAIPRKRKGLDYLKNGLRDFGVRGEFLTKDVSHDEVDAITSALVGVFFWTGKFEALGNDDEDYLIIPDLEKSTEAWLSRTVVGFSGPISAGKTSAARELEKLGFEYGRYSQVIAKMLAEDGKEATREAMQELGIEVNVKLGQRWLGKQLAGLIVGEGQVVIDGLRYPEDHAFWVELYGPAFRHICIEAPTDIRAIRYVNAGNSPEAFLLADSHGAEAHVKDVSRLAAAIIVNDTDLEGFRRRVRALANSKSVK